MEIDGAFRQALQALDADDLNRHASDRFKPTLALLQRAEAEAVSADVRSDLENECRLFGPIGAGSLLVPVDRFVPEIRAPDGVAYLERRTTSASSMVRAFALRALWLFDRKRHPRSGTASAQAFADWFRAASAKSIAERSNEWCTEALEVLSAALQMGLEANQRDLLGQLAEASVTFGEQLSHAGLGRWTLECAEALLLLKKRGLSEEQIGRVSTLLQKQSDAYRDRGNYLQRRFIEIDRDLRAAGRLPESEKYNARAIAESLEEQGDKAPSAIARVDAYRKAAEAFRLVGASVDDQHRVLGKVEAASAEIPKELRRHEFSVEVPKAEIEPHLAVYDRLPIEYALRALCIDVNLQLDPSGLRDAVTEQSGKYIFHALATPVLLRPEGTTFVPADESEHLAVRVAEDGMMHLGIRWQVFLAEIFERLRKRGLSSDHVMAKLLESNLFEESDKPFFERVVRFWLTGDYLSALHIAVPRIEHILRRTCRKVGRPTIKVQQSGNQQIQIDSTLAYLMPFNESLFYELRLVLHDQAGCALRHTIAHGLAEADAYSRFLSDTVLLLLIRLSTLAITPRQPSDDKTTQSATKESELDGPS